MPKGKVIVTQSLNINPPVIAHRGASGYAPENTIAAFTKAAQLGIQWVEFDVMQAACGTPIIFHDETLTRTTNGNGNVEEYDYTYLRSLDAGAWFDPIFSGERIPSLEQVIDFLNEMGLCGNIELKPLPGKEALLVESVLNVIPASLINSNKILFSSFSIDALISLRSYAVNCQMGLLLHDWIEDWQAICESLYCVSVHINQEIITRRAIAEIQLMNKAVLCYTVNDPIRAQELFEWGIDAVFSDVPDRII